MSKTVSLLWLSAASIALAACGQAEDDTPDAASNEASGSTSTTSSEFGQKEDGADTVAAASTIPVASKPAQEPTISDDPVVQRGKVVFYRCRSCHEVTATGPNKVGPNLHGLVGANAAQNEGFNYSEALINANIIWNDETLDGFIENPANYVKGTKMAFVGVRDESDREALVEYLKQATAD